MEVKRGWFSRNAVVHVGFLCCDKTMAKNNFQMPWLFQLGQSPLSRETKAGIQGRNLETEAQTTERCCLLACSQPYAQLSLPYTPGLLAQGWWCPQWTVSSCINYQPRKCLADMALGQSNWSNSSAGVSSSQVTSLCQQNYHTWLPFHYPHTQKCCIVHLFLQLQVLVNSPTLTPTTTKFVILLIYFLNAHFSTACSHSVFLFVPKSYLHF